MDRRCLLLAASVLASSAACSNGEGPDPTRYTVSYRNQVRLPYENEPLSAERFAEQTRSLDPIASIRCPAEDQPAYREVTAFLGGIAWGHPVAILKDSSYPPLYDGKRPSNDGRLSGAGSADASAPPTIERPDLVGVKDGVGVFLSKQHGLLAVDTRGGTPIVSCSMKLPGDPKNFFFRGNELVVIVNARAGHNRAALLRYTFDGKTFRFVDDVRLEQQRIEDARLFDSTIVAYTSWSRPMPQPQAPSGGGGADSRGASATYVPYPGSDQSLGTKLIVVQWDEKLNVDWEDALLSDPQKLDPLEGLAEQPQLVPDQVVGVRATYRSFVAASDRYIAVPRDVQKTVFDGYRTYTYHVCTHYNPYAEQVTRCSVDYERRPNPDYVPPDPLTGDYACNGQPLADCIGRAAPVVSQYIQVPIGQTCKEVWIGRCERSEQRTETYPAFRTENETELAVYRFEGGTFTKLDASLAKLVEKADAIAFEKHPLSVPGTVVNRNQIQFQNGHLYVFADGALQTLAVAKSSVSYVNRLSIETSTETQPAVVFSADRAMISARRSSDGWSTVTMLDISTPALPKKLNGFAMPGQTTQLLLAAGGILGPGRVSVSHQEVRRSLQKLTLFSHDDGRELDNLLLGTEYDTFEQSWLDQDDDQRIRLASGGQRVFLPYSGRHHAKDFEPTAHRLNITRIENGRLVSERSFEVSENIVRTAPLDDAHSLVFSSSGVHIADHTSGAWALTTLRELFVPFATYRINDADVYARVDRVGSKCRITTHAGHGAIFEEASLAEAFVTCGESALPTGFQSNILFAETRSGVRISEDGKLIEPLAAEQVHAFLEQVPRGYCWFEGGKGSRSKVEYLDEVPSEIFCDDD